MTRNAILYGEIYPPNPPITIKLRNIELMNEQGLVGRIQFTVKDSKVIVAGSWAQDLTLADCTQMLRQIAEEQQVEIYERAPSNARLPLQGPQVGGSGWQFSTLRNSPLPLVSIAHSV